MICKTAVAPNSPQTGHAKQSGLGFEATEQDAELPELTQDEAQREAIRRWHALPAEERHTHMHARVFAAGLAEELPFRTMGNRRRVIEAWLIRDIALGGN
jgi:hypothetical protein